MTKLSTDKAFAIACCKVLGIEINKENAPVMRVHLVTEKNSVVNIDISFAVGYGLLTEIDNAMQAK